MKKQTRQITLHFSGDYTKILDTFKANAKQHFRTLEQEILFELNGIYGIMESCNVMTDEDVVEFESENGDDLSAALDTVQVNKSTEVTSSQFTEV